MNKPNITEKDIDLLVTVTTQLIDVASSKRTLKEKLTSRKFLACIALLVVGTCGIFGFTDNTIAIVAFAIMDVLSIGLYVLTEGYIDAVHAKEFVQAFGALNKMLTTKTATEEATQALDEIHEILDESADGTV